MRSQLFEELVSRLQRRVPEGTELTFIPPSTVRVCWRDEPPSFVRVPDSIEAEDLPGNVWVILSHVQDFVVRSINQAWPEEDGRLAEIGVRRIGISKLKVWIGREDHPAIDFGEFDLREQ